MTAPTPDGLVLSGLAVGYKRRGRATTVLSGLDAAARRGELTVLLGPNGTGKSTLLRTLAGLQPALGGEQVLDGEDLTTLSDVDRARRMAVVLTDRVDPGLLTARELAGLGRHPHTGFTGALTEADHAVVSWALEAVGAGHLTNRQAAELSDGERQRVLTARALAQEPGLILLDEPSAFLDAPSRVALTGLLRRLARDRDLAVLVSSHDLELALRTADHVWLVDRDGQMHSGTPEELAVGGQIAATFDTDDLVFDPASGTFVPPAPAGGTVRITAGDPAILGRALAREGWRPVEGEADIEIAPGHVGLADGVRTPLGSLGEVSAWARALGHAPRAIRRAGCGPALAGAASFGAYFRSQAFSGTPVAELYADPGEAVRVVGARLGEVEWRVAASTMQFGYAARLWSLALGALSAGGVLPDLDPMTYEYPEEGPVALSPGEGGWLVPLGEAPVLLARIVIDGHLRPLHAGLRSRGKVAEGLLWGNAAAALSGAVRVIGDPALEPVHAALLAMPPLAGTLDGTLRRSCCLYYRTPSGGYCGNCPLPATRQETPA
ncbi:ATP-binding cassette domain-containing protein [Longispora albida]|uniref:ATP-binding cassette domain-containing protein n=1 Tax=Longispora albida TaxID=203523 RepID=UPI00036D1266|nr:ATP-binding cassette domain-containing protein [Longispora albida]